MRDEPRPRVVIKRAPHGEGHHGGAWKVAYADFVTTMMALFIVLWIVGQSEPVKHAVARYFRDPGSFREGRGEGRSTLPTPGGAGLLPADVAPPGAATDPAHVDPAREEQALQEAAARIKRLTAEGGGFESLREQIRIEVTPEGLRIELIERDESPFFQVGSAAPIPQLQALLEQLEPILASLPNHITLEGHTDARPYSQRRNYSNWELSTDRAHSARRILEAGGLPHGRIDRIVGHADRLLRVPHDPLHATNRRISLLVRRQAG